MTTDYIGFCVRCKAKRQFPGTLGATPKGQPFAKGPCYACGVSMVTFIRMSMATFIRKGAK